MNRTTFNTPAPLPCRYCGALPTIGKDSDTSLFVYCTDEAGDDHPATFTRTYVFAALGQTLESEHADLVAFWNEHFGTVAETPLTPCVACLNGDCPACSGMGYHEQPPFPPYGIRAIPCGVCGGDGRCATCRGDAFANASTELPPLPTDEPLYDVSPLDALGSDARMNANIDFPALWHQTNR